MTKLAFRIIAAVTPRSDRDSVLCDTHDRFDELRQTDGLRSARRWLWRETLRVVWHAPRHRFVASRSRHERLVLIKESSMSSVWQDIRYATRWLRRSPAFTAIAVLTLALGIGANTAIFAVVNAVLLKPLPFPNADRLMLVHLVAPQQPGGDGPAGDIEWSFPKFETLRDVQQVFDGLALFGRNVTTLSGDGEPEEARAEAITEDYLSTLGLAPSLGRVFTFAESSRAGAEPVALISHGLWTRRYGADAAVLGRVITLGGKRYTVVGVMPRGFRGLSGNVDIWTPLAVSDAWALTVPQGHSFMLVALRKPGVTEIAAESAVRTYGNHIDAAHRQESGESWTANAVSLNASRVDRDVRQLALVILAAVGFVLLMACVNLTNLMAARAAARKREMAIRTALGASRGRIVRQVVVEGMTLASGGGVVGVAMAAAILTGAPSIMPAADVFFRTSGAVATLPVAGAEGLTRIGAAAIGLDIATLIFTVLMTLVTAVLVSTLPALQISELRPGRSLKLKSAALNSRAPLLGPRGLLATAQIALALILLTGAGLLLRSAFALRDTNLGIDPNHVVTAGLQLPGASYNAERGRTFYSTLISRLEALPGVDEVGVSSCLPVSGTCNGTSINFPAEPRKEITTPVGVVWATSGYFKAQRVSLVSGRPFADSDRAGQPKVAIVNQTAARMFWPNGNAIGQRIAVGQGGFQDGAEVIGVVADVRYRSIESAARPDVYLPFSQSYRGRMQLSVRTDRPLEAIVPAIAGHVRSLDTDLPLVSVSTMTTAVGDAMWRTRVAAWLLGAFAVLALVLTATGVFGVMSQVVAQRTAEFGIRFALGATAGNVLSLVLRQALTIIIAGLGIGLVCALAGAQVLQALLYRVSPTDPLTLGVVVLALAGVALFACYVPFRRATRIDAMVAFKSE